VNDSSKVLAFFLFLGAAAALFGGGRLVGFPLDVRQVESLTIFSALVLGVLMFEDHRLAISLGGVAALLALGLLTTDQFVASAGLDVVLFLMGTYLVAGFLEQDFFFDHLASQIVRAVGPRPGLLLAVLMIAAMAASAIVGEVAAILFVGGAMLQIAKRCQINPGPFLMMLVFATNTGSAASAFGPVGVTISLKAHLGVWDFFRWAAPIAVANLGLTLILCRVLLAADWRALAEAMRRQSMAVTVPDPAEGRSAAPGWLLVLAMAAVLIFHQQIEHVLHLTDNTMLLAVALGAGAAALLMSGRHARELIEQRVDWATLAFFLMLFSAVGALQATGVTAAVAEGLMRHTGGRPAALVLVIGWATGLLSAILANMLAVAAFLPVVAHIRASGVACPQAVYWLMLFGATFMGNMTSIGSTCNIVACGMAVKRGHGRISFMQWFKTGIIVSLAAMALATVLLAVQTGGLSR
jgi:Na+/H+ antiporter NhaD/arsenite permease-like protein